MTGCQFDQSAVFATEGVHMKSIEQDGVTALLLNEPEREILKKALERAKKTLAPPETAVIEAAVKFLTRTSKMPL